MIIALDIDGTYTADMELWDQFIVIASRRGHKIVIATMRNDQEAAEVVSHFGSRVERVVATDRKAKVPFLAALGIFPTIWIDDEPHWLLKDAKGGDHTINTGDL